MPARRRPLHMFSLVTQPLAGHRDPLLHGPFYGSAETQCIAELAEPGLLVVITLIPVPLSRGAGTAVLSPPAGYPAFPDWETLPYDNFSPHQDIISERLRTLYQLPAAGGVLIVPVPP